MDRTLDALFYPFTICLDETALKYLLLLYDRILYLPVDNLLNRGHDTLSKRGVEGVATPRHWSSSIYATPS